MEALTIATTNRGFLITNTEDEFVVLDKNATIIHRCLTMEGALQWAADEANRREGPASPQADDSGATPLYDPRQPGE